MRSECGRASFVREFKVLGLIGAAKYDLDGAVIGSVPVIVVRRAEMRGTVSVRHIRRKDKSKDYWRVRSERGDVEMLTW